MGVRHYLSQDARDPFQEWLDGLTDIRIRVAVIRRIDRLAAGRHRECHRTLERLQESSMITSRKPRITASRDHEEATIASLRSDPDFAAAYLDAVLEDGDQDEFLLALRRLSEACGGVQSVAARARLNPTTLYRTLSARGNPELKSMRALLRALGLRLSVEPIR